MSDHVAKSPSGFPEWTPEARRVEKKFIETFSSIYERYGYTPIETCSVEKVNHLATSGDVGKEIYGIHRLNDERKKCEFGLHFDLTLPFARYIAENAGVLNFPFKRYQIQKVWRGERPQAGRFREFYQSDIDIVGDGELPTHFESEVVEVINEIFHTLDLGGFKVKINNRKLLEGFYRQAGIEDMNSTLIAVDKIDKIGKEEVEKLLRENGLTQEQANVCTELAAKKFSLSEAAGFLDTIDASSDMLAEAKAELKAMFENLGHLPENSIVFDLSIARGLDYYTGSVYECVLDGLEQYGSVCSGGRYDNLAQKFTKRKLPGVGLSIGLTRLLHILLEEGRVSLLPQSPTQAMVILFDEKNRPKGNQVANQLRQAGINTEVSPEVRKFGKQIQFAEKRGAKYIVIPEEDGTVNMKNLSTGDQEALDMQKMKTCL